ncbi:hypothetical protein O6H91_13G090600 [Diphasiastrum complanatum]|uniref:Uncharacterized protein n=1 Tax=Diphasiastrum complanatum TaxID=34168 RepID=A0ACC2BXK2_DIPCM|nr:hypothetical protein O6H91_13G090600 [Diphasiastrum complanatum]
MASAGSSLTDAPSPIGPLRILALVLFIWVAPSYFNLEPASEDEEPESTIDWTSLAPFVLIAVLLLLVLRYIFSSPDDVMMTVLGNSLTNKSTFLLGGLLILVLGLIWLRSAIQSAWE